MEVFMKKLFLFFIFLLILPQNVCAANEARINESITTRYVKGEVIEIIEENKDKDYHGQIPRGYQKFKITVLTGNWKDKTFIIENTSSGNPTYSYWVNPGTRLIVAIHIADNKILNVNIEDYQRDNYIFYLILLFTLLLIFIGQEQGLKSLLSLGITIAIIAFVMLPLIYQGFKPVELALITCIIITTLTLLIIGGLSKKTVAAILGTCGGLLLATAIALIFGYLSHLRGLSEDEAQMLMNIPHSINFDFSGLLFAGIIIGALGAIMDVSMSIASSMEEIYYTNRNLSLFRLIRSGMNIGKDIMGTMSNTLILAYTGASLPLLLLFMSYNPSLVKLFNLDFIATELIRALSGSIGLILAIPLTAILAGVLLKL